MVTPAPMDPHPVAAPLDPLPMRVPERPPVRFRRFDDLGAQRSAIYDYAREAVAGLKPLENANYRLEIADVDYDGPFTPTKAQEKRAIMEGTSLQRALRGTVRLVNQEDGTPVDEQRVTLAHIPHLNSRGLFIRNGVVWSLRNQNRLRPGAYTRLRADGAAETQFNVKPGTGRGFRVMLEPDTGLFKLTVGQSSTRLYPLLRASGLSDEDIKEMWGEELFEKNFRPHTAKDSAELRKIVEKLGSRNVHIDEDQLPQAFRDLLARAELDPETTELTLGRPVQHLSPEDILGSTQRVLQVARRESPGDNRDSQAFQSVHSAEDLVKERLGRDQAGLLRRLLWKATREGRLGSVQTGLLDRNLSTLFEGSGLAQTVEDVNPFEIYDQFQAVTRLGEGGLSSEQAVSRDARGVQASYLGFIDSGRGPESSRLGLDMRLTDTALKGSDNQLYTEVINARTGEPEIVSARTLSAATIAFPGEMDKDSKRIAAVRGRDEALTYVTRDEVDYILPSANNMMSRTMAMIPFPQAVKGQRALMGSRMTQQAMPLLEGEAPLVQTADATGASLHKEMGRYIGAAYTPVSGTVIGIKPDEIRIRTQDGEVRAVDLYNNYPSARKTMIHNTPVVQKGDVVEEGQLLARSNFTDDTGTAAIGRNLRVAFMVAEGDTIEDAFKVSESAARKLTSEALYKSDLHLGDIKSTDKDAYRAIYTDKYTPEQYDKLGDDGVARVGEEVRPGDPLILGFSKRRREGIGAVMDTDRSRMSDRSQTWEHQSPGIVTDVARTRSGIKVTVKSHDTLRKGDKLSMRYGNKGITGTIVPDDQMPQTADGEPIEVIANALGIISRVNPGALAEALLGRVAQVRGEPYVVKAFDHPDVAEFALQEALKYGVVRQDPDTGEIIDTEDLIDPRDGSKIPSIFVGNSYVMKLHHMAEGKLGARDVGAYTTEGIPARGGRTGSKRIGTLDVAALISSGSTNFLRDAKLIRGQRNDDYWRAVRSGESPVAPERSFANDHFENLLRAAGVNLRKEGTRTHLSPALDEDVDRLAEHEIENPGTFDFETMRPVPGGMFDVKATGGAGGNRFSKITLPEAIPHPLFLDPIQRILGLTRAKLEGVLAGKEELNKATGPEAIKAALKAVNIDREVGLAKEVIRTGRASQRDLAVKKLNYLTGLKDMGVSPEQLMVTRMPVIPPKYRPISSARNTDIVHDLNYLYHDLLEARQNYTDALETFGEAGEEYLTMVQAAQAISGVRDPVTQRSAEQGVRGILRHAIGVGDTPKHAVFQRKVIGSALDTVGRGVIAPDANLDMDEIGVPVRMAYEIYRPYIIRRLRRGGIPASEALQAVRGRSDIARRALEEEIKERPVVYNRAPALHRYAYVGAWPRIRDDDAIGLPYQTLKGLNADYDGDAINIHVPASDEAVQDARTKLMPSRNLFFTGDFETHLEPVQDYLAGLYLASKPKEGETVRTFANEEEARRAFARGEISTRTPIRILQ